MSNKADKILFLASNFERNASDSLVKSAKKKEEKKSKKTVKKEDKPSAEKSKPAEKEKDSKKKFPFWLKKKKSYIEKFDAIIYKFAQNATQDPASAKNRTDSLIQSINAINTSQLTPEQVKQQANDFAMNGFRNFQSQLITNEQYSQIVAASEAKMKSLPSQTINTPVQEILSPAKPSAPVKPREDVASAQRKLNSLIMSGKLQSKVLDPDGKMGPLTRAVLKEYKESLKLPSFTDEQMVAALNKASEPPTDAPANNQNQVAQTWATPPVTPPAGKPGLDSAEDVLGPTPVATR